MQFRRTGSLGSQANAAVNDFASKVDGQTTVVAARMANVVSVAVRLLRVPTAVVGAIPVPFILATYVLGLAADGSLRIVILVAAVLMSAVCGAFWGRRRMVLKAVEEPDKLATELGIMISLSDKVGETRGALNEIAGGGGWRVFGRLKGVYNGVSMTGRWIDSIGDLPRARYFAPPKIGTTVSVTIAALWLIPISVAVVLLAVIGSIADSL